MTARYPRFIFAIILAIFSLGAVMAVYYSTPAGVGLANDSVAYIAGARSILQGKGYSDIWLDSTIEPITHYPPLLSLSLSVLGLLGIDPLRGARILNILLFGTNTALVGWLGWRMTREFSTGVWSAVIFLLNASLLRVHIFALSEPLFLFFSLVAFLFFDLHFSTIPLANKRRSPWLLLTGLAVGLAFLARYSALALLPTFSVALLLFPTTPGAQTTPAEWRARLVKLSVFFAGAIPLIIAWFVRNKLNAGSVTNRTFQYHALTRDNIQPAFYNFSQFLMPVESWRQSLLKTNLLHWLIGIVGFLMFTWLVIQVVRLLQSTQDAQSTSQPLLFTNILYMFGYLGAVLFSMSFFDASTKFQTRILAPLYVGLILLLPVIATWLWHQVIPTKANRWLVLILVLVTISASALEFSRAIREFSSAGQGYASWKWHDSFIMASLKNLPADIAIYTNTPPAVYLVTGRASRTLPTPIDPVDNLVRADYQDNLDMMLTDLHSGRAVLALFDTSSLDEASGSQNIQSLITDLNILQKAQGDVLYGKP